MTPTSKVSVAETVKSRATCTGSRPRGLPVRMASVVVVLTLSTREFPSAA
jgi:hypothetical protein